MIENMIVRECYGDGITITGTSDLVCVRHSSIEDNGRNNISVINATNVEICDCKIDHAYRVSPMAGIDIEPNNNTEHPSVNIHDCVFNNNVGKCISIANQQGSVENIHVSNIYANTKLFIFNTSTHTNVTASLNFIGKDITIDVDNGEAISIAQNDSKANIILENVLLKSDDTYSATNALILFTGSYQSSGIYNVRIFNLVIDAPNATNLFYRDVTSSIVNAQIDFRLIDSNVLNLVSGFPEMTIINNSEHAIPISGNTTLNLTYKHIRVSGSEEKTLSIVSTNFSNGSELYIVNVGSANCNIATSGGRILNANSNNVIVPPDSRLCIRFDSYMNRLLPLGISDGILTE